MNKPLVLLALITLLGGILRFTSLGQPAIWGDEALAYGRVCGTYQELTDVLAHGGGFTPLHYETLWWLKEGCPLWAKIVPGEVEASPFGGGGGMGPGGFGRGFGRRRPDVRPPPTADGKVRKPYVLTPTARIFSDGLVLTPFLIRLPSAIAGTLMVPAMYFLARQLVSARTALLASLLTACSAYLLVYSRDAKMYAPIWFFATVSVGAFLCFLQTRDRLAWWAWVAASTAMLGTQLVGATVIGVQLLMVLTTPRAHWRTFLAVPLTILAAPLLGAGGLISRWNENPAPANLRVKRFLTSLWTRPGFPPLVAFLIGVIIIGIAPANYWYNFSHFAEDLKGPDGDIIRAHFGMGLEWIDNYNEGRDGPGHVLFTATAFLFSWEWPAMKSAIKAIDPRVYKVLTTGAIAFAGIAAVGLFPLRRRWSDSSRGLLEGGCPQPPSAREDVATFDVPRETAGEDTRSPAESPSTPSVATAVSAVLTPPGGRDGRRYGAGDGRRTCDATFAWWQALLWIGLWIVVVTYGAYIRCVNGFVPPSAWLDAAKSWLFDSTTDGWQRLRPANFGPAAATHLLIIAAVLAIAAACARGQWRTRLARFGIILACITAWLVVCYALYRGGVAFSPTVKDIANGKAWEDVWMPRYLGTIVPAVFIALAVLMRRLPTRWLRWPAVVLFIAFNLAQFGGRVYGGSEPPTDKFVADIVASQGAGAKFRAYTELNRGRSPTPAGGMAGTTPYAYYLAVTGPTKITSRLGWQGTAQSEVSVWGRTLPMYIARDLKASPGVERFVTWDAYDDGKPPVIGQRIDPQLAAVGRLVGEQVYAVRDHWTWVPRVWVVRREYVRVGSPPTTRSSK